MYRSSEDGGDLIINYELWRNTGGSSTTYVKVTSYNCVGMIHTISVSADSLVSGTIYKFMTVATNAFGSSDFSDELNAGVSSFPARPSPVTQVVPESGQTFITIQWTTSSDTQLPVIGYKLQMNDGKGGNQYFDVK